MERHEQDRDKRRTYDLARVQYAHLSSMLMLDADELLLCREGGVVPSSSSFSSLPTSASEGMTPAVSIEQFAQRQQQAMSSLVDRGEAEGGGGELLFQRPTFFGRHPTDTDTDTDTSEGRHGKLTLPELNEHTMRCMQTGHAQRSLGAMLSCWGPVHYNTVWKKSSDTSGICPFHFAHWACSPPSDKARDK
jgi:hypothetical protein